MHYIVDTKFGLRFGLKARLVHGCHKYFEQYLKHYFCSEQNISTLFSLKKTGENSWPKLLLQFIDHILASKAAYFARLFQQCFLTA